MTQALYWYQLAAAQELQADAPVVRQLEPGTLLDVGNSDGGRPFARPARTRLKERVRRAALRLLEGTRPTEGEVRALVDSHIHRNLPCRRYWRPSTRTRARTRDSRVHH